MVNNWNILDESMATKKNGYKVLCRCVCGTEKLVSRKYIKQGKSKSCGCHGVYVGAVFDGFEIIDINLIDNRNTLTIICHGCSTVYEARKTKLGPRIARCLVCNPVNKVHGESAMRHRTREYNIWRNMRQRCNAPTHKAYHYYGGRGIKVCKRWDDYRNFLDDMGRMPRDKTSLDRIDNDGDYEPSNCRWADWFEQRHNRRDSGGSYAKARRSSKQS